MSRYFTCWREPAVREVLVRAGWSVVSVDHVAGRKESWLYVLARAKLRAPGERANTQLKTWRILRKPRCCLWKAGQLAKAIHVLQVREAEGLKKAQCAVATDNNYPGHPGQANC